MYASLTAVIRRTPGGKFQKVAKSPTMCAIPAQTTLDNLTTYFSHWPKRRALFLMYGGPQTPLRRPFGSRAPASSRLPEAERARGPGRREGGGGEADFGHAYGPAAGGAADSGSGGKPAAAARASRPLGLAGVGRKFARGEKLTMVTAYDFPSARLARGAGLELVLVGDSLGNCRLGLPDTVGVTMDDMLRATVSVRRGVDAPLMDVAADDAGPKPMVVGDMPFGSYLQEADALRNAAALRVAGAEMVKLEGGRQVAPLVQALTNAGIPVMGHVGLAPQSAVLQGGFKMQGTTAKRALEVVKDAQALVDAGAVALVIECVPGEVAHAVQAAVPTVPVIGIGAGSSVAGQVLVCDDLLGVHGKAPSFVKQYADLARTSAEAYRTWVTEVRSGHFPGPIHSQKMKLDELTAMEQQLPELGVHFKKPPPAPLQPVAWPGSAIHVGASPVKEQVAAQSLPIRVGAFWAQPRTAFGARLLSTVCDSVGGPSVGGGAEAFAKAAEASAKPAEVEVLRTRQQMNAWRRTVGRVAMVPTMGNLHEGHLELIDEAKKHADQVLVSIFVNPAQFAPHEDLDCYPRTFERDLELLAARGASACFVPTPKEMYPRGSPGGVVVVPKFVQGLSEDACRPHFFTGVATVCLKLFNICQPDVVVFGQKDAMQCVVIRRMLEDLDLDTRVSMVVAPTSREEDGLARSSRNSYLTPDMRRRAPAIYASLSSAASAPGATPASVRDVVKREMEVAGMDVSYVSVAGLDDMQEKEGNAPLEGSVISVACLLRDGSQECRLIDNVVVPASSGRVCW